MPHCFACNANKAPSQFSRSQLRKIRKRCKECIKNGIQLTNNKQMKNQNDLSSSFKALNITTPTVKWESKRGQCHFMCPHKESSIRIAYKQYHPIFECDANKKVTKFSLIKEYSRSSAGQQIDLKDVRCASTLRQTMHYLMNNILNNTSTTFVDRYSFFRRSNTSNYQRHLCPKPAEI